MEEMKCLCGCSNVRVVACCGASNVGQIANQAAIELAKEKVAGFFCLAGVGAHELGYKRPEPTSCLNRGEKVYDYIE
jgi:uncharacterized metal-binding protein